MSSPPSTEEATAELLPLLPWDRGGRRARGTSRVVRVVGLLALSVPIMVAGVWPGSLWDESLGVATIVIGDWVPTLVGPTGTFLAVGVCAVVAAPIIGSWPTRDRVAAVAIRVASSVAAIVLVLSAANAWLGIWAADRRYLLMGEPSDGGCQIVGAQGSSGFHRVRSDLGILHPGETRVEWLITDVTTRSAPLQHGFITWEGDVATLHISELDDTERLEDLTVRCDVP